MKIYLRKLLIITLIICTAISFSFSPAFASEKEKIEVSAESAIVYCENTGETVFQKNRDKQINPLSITKLMTVLLAIQNLPFDQDVTVSAEAVKQEGSSMGLVEGEVVKAKDLIYAAMMLSANDAAYAIGEAISGDIESFVNLMNTTAANIGCKNTHFKNTNGLPQEGHISTAYDMLQITKIALSNDKIKEIAGTEEFTLSKTNMNEARTIVNVMGKYKDAVPGLKVGKTGYESDENCSIAFKHEDKGMSLWIVLLQDTKEERINDCNTLIEYAHKKIKGLKIVGKDRKEGKVRVKHGAKTTVPVYTEETGYAYLPKQASDTLISTNVSVNNDVEAPLKKGQVVGKYQIYVADELVNEINLIVKEDVQTGWFTSYLGISNNAAIIIAAVIIALIAFFIWISVLNMKARKKRKMMRRKKILQMAEDELRREKEHNDRGWNF